MVGFRKTPDIRWQEGCWQLTGAVAGDLSGIDNATGRRLHAASTGQQYLWTGLHSELFRDETES